MVKAKPKPFDVIKHTLSPYSRILVVGCGGCASVCLAGGQKEVRQLIAALSKGGNTHRQIQGITIERQCHPQYLSDIKELAPQFDCLLSMGCGAGAQLMAEFFPDIPLFPALDTVAIGVDRGVGVYEEKCRACGNCLIGYTGGICPVTRCAKGLFNGPCGGASLESCEVDPTVPCAWVASYQRLKRQNRLEAILAVTPATNWRNQTQRTVVQDLSI